MSFLRRFRRRPAPPVEVRFTEDWRPGDLGICVVNGGGWLRRSDAAPVPGPQRDRLVRVVDTRYRDGFAGLVLRGWGPHWWQANCFRKVPPLEAEPCSAEFKRKIEGGAGVPSKPKELV